MMKKLLIMTTILLYCFLSSTAQENSENQNKIFKVWVSLNKKPVYGGVLFETKDSSIIVTDSYYKSNYSAGRFRISEINYNDINVIKIQAKNSVLKGIFLGAVTGFVVGAIIGAASGDDNPNTYVPHGYLDTPKTAGNKALSGGVVSMFLGGGIGAVVGTFKLIIPINGNFDKFRRNKSRLERHSFQ